MTNRCQIRGLGRFRPNPVRAVKIKQVNFTIYKPGFVCERQRGEEVTTEQGEGCVGEQGIYTCGGS